LVNEIADEAKELAKAITRHSPLIADNLGLAMTPADLKHIHDYVTEFDKIEAARPSLTVGDWLDRHG